VGFDGPDGNGGADSGRLQVKTTRCCDADVARAGAESCFCAQYLVENDFANDRLVRLLRTTSRGRHHCMRSARPTARFTEGRSLVNHLTNSSAFWITIGSTPVLVNQGRAELFAGKRAAGGSGSRQGGRPSRCRSSPQPWYFERVPRRLAALLDDSKKLTLEQRLRRSRRCFIWPCRDWRGPLRTADIPELQCGPYVELI